MIHFNYLPQDVQDKLRATANAIVVPGKGILAADESTGISLSLQMIWINVSEIVSVFRNNG